MRKHRIGRCADIPPGGRKLTTRGGIEFGIFRVGERFFAWRNLCPHAGAPVCIGKIESCPAPSGNDAGQESTAGALLRCPWHGWEFDLETGQHRGLPEARLRPVRLCEEEGELFVYLPE